MHPFLRNLNYINSRAMLQFLKRLILSRPVYAGRCPEGGLKVITLYGWGAWHIKNAG